MEPPPVNPSFPFFFCLAIEMDCGMIRFVRTTKGYNMPTCTLHLGRGIAAELAERGFPMSSEGWSSSK